MFSILIGLLVGIVIAGALHIYNENQLMIVLE